MEPVNMNTSDLAAITGRLDGIKGAIGNIKVTVNASFSDAQSKFTQALNNAVETSMHVAATKLSGFVTQSTSKMQTQISTVERNLGDQVQKVQTITKTLEHKTTSAGVDFEQKRLDVMQRQAALMSKQEQAFGKFSTALKQLAEKFMTVSGFVDASKKALGEVQIANMTLTSRETFKVNQNTMTGPHQVNEGDANQFYQDQIAPMIKSKYNDPENFKKNQLVQLATAEGGDASILNEKDELGNRFSELEIEKRVLNGISKRLEYARQLKQDKNPEKQQQGIELEGSIIQGVNSVTGSNASVTGFITSPDTAKQLEHERQYVQNFVNLKDPGKAASDQQTLINHNFDNTLLALEKGQPILDAYYKSMEELLKQCPDFIAIAKNVSAFGLAIAGVVGIAHDLLGGLNALRGGGLLNTIKNSAGKAWEYGKSAVMGEGGAAGAIRGLSSSELLATGGGFALRASPWLMALSLRGDTRQTPEQLEKEIQYKRKNAFKEMQTNQQEVAGYEKRFGEKVNYYDDERGFVLENQFGGSQALGQSLELVKHTMHELQANSKKTEAVEKATGLQLTFSAPAKHFVLINQKGQIVYDIGKKLSGSQEDMIKGAQDAQAPSMWYPPNWFSSSTDKKQDQSKQGKLEPILRTSAMQSSPVFVKPASSDNVGVNMTGGRSTNNHIASALQQNKQLANSTQNITNSDQRFSFNIHLSALTNDFTPLKQWFQHELPTMLKQYKSPAFVDKKTVNSGHGQF